MTQTSERTIKVINQLRKSDPQLYSFFESLLYGTWGKKNSIAGELMNYNMYTKRASECVMYLHENHVQLLICIDKWMTGYRKYFNIKNIQVSQLNPVYEMDSNLEKDKCTFIIKSDLILKQRHQQTVILFDNIQKRNTFKTNLQKLRKVLRSIPDLYDPMVLKAFIKADLNQNGEISWQELKGMIRMMKIDLNPNMKQVIKNILGKQTVERIYFGEFQRLWKIFYCRKQLEQVFQKYDNQKFSNYDEYLMPKLDIKEFKKFLISQQLQTQEEANKIIKRLYLRDDISLSFYDFCHYMFGQQNNLINENYRNSEIDTSKPLNHYHCYSSHNTYLTGDQLFSSSRAQRYLIDLQNGLRCVEIDVHDGNDVPIVKHGYTPTPSVTFQEVIKSVRRFTLLQPNHTPIILSIQNHCDQKNQLLMSKILIQNFNDKILRVNPYLGYFPSLKECIGKIIIKGPGNFKLFMQNMKSKSLILQDSCSEEQIIDIQGKSPENLNKSISKNNKIPITTQKQVNGSLKTSIVKKNSKQMNSVDGAENKNENGLTKMILKENSNKYHQKFKVSGKFLEIICMLSKAKVQNIENGHWESNSFSQQKIVKLFLDPKEKENITNLSKIKWFRSYPDGLRIWSSNYDPLPALQLGIQIVAINTQTQDDVNHHILKAFFMKGMNKTPGYRKKCQSLLKNEKEEQKREKYLTTISIKFISGLRIYQNDDDFKTIPPVSIKASFSGTQRDNQMNQNILVEKQFTEEIDKQSFCPKFKKSKPLQINCCDPQLGFLIVEVPDCGRSVIPIDAMRHGWRVFSLYDHELRQKQSKILCQIKINRTQISQ